MYCYIKRLIDIVISVLAIIVSAPLWLVVSLGIFISDPGPIFYKAIRIGRDNKEFRMLKFRSMRVEREKEISSEVSLRPENNRIFEWGRIIRKYKMDEIPQFVNVLLGDMSLVGPRPVAKDQKDLFRFGKYDEARMVKPGLTGPAALFDYIYGDQFEDNDIDEYMKKVYPIRRELEYIYVKKCGFIFDTWVVYETIICLLCTFLKKGNDRLLTKLYQLVNDGCYEPMIK